MQSDFPPHLIAAIKRHRNHTARGGSQAASVPTTIVISPSNFSLSTTGSAQLVATVFDQFGAPMPGESVTWSSGTPAVATVSTGGLVSAVATGSSTITATDGSIHGTATCTVTTNQTWHIALNGTVGGDGSSGSPWDLSTGWNKATTVQPGDTVEMHAGAYGTGVESLTISLTGTPTQPIIIKPAPGELVSLNIKTVDFTGHDFWLYNDDHFNGELYNGLTNPDGTDLTRFDGGDGIKVLNWVIHDGGGIGLAPQNETSLHEVNGNIVYYNGRSLTLRPVFGHGIYAHGTTIAGQKRKIRGNIVFGQAGYGIHTFADTGNLDNFEVHWNFGFLNGLPDPGNGNAIAGHDMLIGGQTALTDCDIQHNATVNPNGDNTATIGYYADGDPGALCVRGLVQHNYNRGVVNLGNWDNAGVTITLNTWVGAANQQVRWKFQNASASAAMSGNAVSDQTYASTSSAGFGAFSIQVGASQTQTTYDTLAAYKAALGSGEETNSTFDAVDNNVGTVIRVSNNEFVAGRSHLFIDNPSGASTVTVPAAQFAQMVQSGAPYEVWSVLDLKTETNPGGTPMQTGTFTGADVVVNMTGKTPKPVLGGNFSMANPLPQVGVFVVIQTSAVTAPTITPSPTTLAFSATVGGNNPAVQTANLTSSPAAMGLAASISYTSGSGWLSIALDQDRTNAALAVTALTGSLAAGTYNATITITSSNAATITVPVTFTVNAAGGDPAGFDTLQTALGGSTHVIAAYDRRQNWSATSVTDTRFSGGTGPALTKDGAPTLDGNGNLVFASGDDFHSAASALFKLTGAGSMLLVASCAANTNPAGISPSASPSVYAQVSCDATKIGMWNDAQTDTTVAVGATLRPIIMTWDGVKTATIQVANQAAVQHVAGANFDSGNCVLTLGGWFDTNGANGGVTVAACLMVDHVVNSTEISAFVTYATGQLGATAA